MHINSKLRNKNTTPGCPEDPLIWVAPKIIILKLLENLWGWNVSFRCGRHQIKPNPTQPNPN